LYLAQQKKSETNMQDKNQLLFGIRSVIEAINAGKEIEKVLIRKGLQGELYQELFSLVNNRKIPFQFVPLEKINRITRKNHQGVIAFMSLIEYQSLEALVPGLFESGRTPFILILDQVTDVRNFGSIARTAECAGVDAIVIPDKGAAQINSDAIKTSAGALNRIAVCRSHSLTGTLKFLKESGLIIAAATEKAEQLPYDKVLTGPVALIMGAEDKGISPSLLKIADEWLKIPVNGQIASLNVAVATGVIVYEIIRQRMVAQT